MEENIKKNNEEILREKQQELLKEQQKIWNEKVEKIQKNIQILLDKENVQFIVDHIVRIVPKQ